METLEKGWAYKMLQYMVQFTYLYSTTRQTSSWHSVSIKNKYCGMFIYLIATHLKEERYILPVMSF